MAMRFHAGNSKAGKPRWWLFSSNGKQVASSGEDFASVSNAKRAAEDFKASAKDADYDVYLDKGTEWRWRAIVSSDKVATSGEAFDSKSNAQRAADNVRDNAGSATGP